MNNIKRCMFCEHSYREGLDEFCNVFKEYVDSKDTCDLFKLSRFKLKISLFKDLKHKPFPSNFCILCVYYEKHENIEYCRLEQHGWYCPLDTILE